MEATLGELAAFLETNFQYDKSGDAVLDGTSTEGFTLRNMTPSKKSSCEDVPASPCGNNEKIIPHQVEVYADYFEAHFYMTRAANGILEPLIFMLLTGNGKSTIHLHFCGDRVYNDVLMTLISLLEYTKVNTVAHVAVAMDTATLALACSCKKLLLSPLSLAAVTPMQFGAWNTDKLVMEDMAAMRRYEDILLKILMEKGVVTQGEYEQLTKTGKVLQLVGDELCRRIKPVATPIAE
jgi:hypothetical protein